MFYASVSIKFARLASLLVSSYYGNKITQDVTGEELSNNIFFQNFYYNDAARLNMAIIPLIMFESIKDLKFLILATLIDVLTTATSDLNVGKAISNADQIIAEQTAITINEISKTLSSHDAISSNDDIQVDLLGE